MTAGIVDSWVPSAREWDKAWNDCPYSTFFHGREWAEIWAEYRCGKATPDPLGITFTDGTRILLPFSKEKKFFGLFQRYISSPAGTFGGWLADVPLSAEQQSVLMRFIAKQYSNILWRLNPYEVVLPQYIFSRLQYDQTHVLDLSVGFDEIYRGWTKGHASAARKARKAGVLVRVAKNRDDWAEYFRVYQDSISRWGANTTSTYAWPLFEIMHMRSSPNIKLWLAEYEGVVIAGALCFYSPAHVAYWHGAALSSYFDVRPVNLLMYEAIRDAAEQGFSWFDFNPSGGLAGVRDFKKSFGTVELASEILSKENSIFRILLKIRALI